MEPRLLCSVYFVATTGSDHNPGTIVAPFQTIQRAAGVAQPGDTVLVHAGTYREMVRPASSGRSNAPITFDPFGDGPVIISGADPVGGWSGYKGSIYQARMPWDLGEGRNQVFVDGQMRNEARWPATSLDVSHPAYAHADDLTVHVADGADASTGTLKDAALVQPAGFWNGATLRISPGQGWAFQTGTVTDSSPDQLSFTYTADASTSPYTVPAAGDAYSLTGTFGALDSPGEWFRQPDGSLYLWTPGGDSPDAHDVEVKHRQFAFDLSGRSNIYVTGFTLLSDTIETDNDSHGLILSHLDIEYGSQFTAVPDPWTAPDDSGDSAVTLNGTNNDLKDSTIAFSAGNGVLVAGSNNTVQGCTIHDTDTSGANFAGVTTTGPHASVLDNVIYNAGRNGVRISGTPVKIINNVVHDVMLQTTDGGGIYTWGNNGAGSEVANNQVYNVRGGGFGAAGIYLDNNDSNWRVDHNTVWNCTHAIKLNPVNTNDRIEFNTFANCDDGVATSGSGQMPGTVFSNNTFTESVTLGPGATEQGDVHGGTFQSPADPAPDAALAASHGSFAAPPGAGPQLAADAQKVQDDLSQVATDIAAGKSAFAEVQASIKADVAAATVTLNNDRAARNAARAANLAAVANDRALIRAKRGDPATLAADRARLAQEDATWRAKLAADKQAIHAAKAAGAAKLKADKVSWAAMVQTDRQKLKADELQLTRDEKL